MKRWSVGIGALLLSISTAWGQSFNVDFGIPGSPPAWHYAAAGFAGVWNDIGLPGNFVRVPLIGLDGQPTAAKVYQFGFSTQQQFDHAGTSGDHQSLLDDYFHSVCTPVDGCIWIEGLQNGTYEVITYAFSPDLPSRQSQCRVDFGSPGPMWVGGAWTGAHVQGITYSRHVVTTTSGGIAFHSGIYNSQTQSVMNGFQLTYLDGPLLPVYPDQVQVTQGMQLGGTVQSLFKGDDERFVVLGDELQPVGEVELVSTSPRTNPAQMQFIIESFSTRNDISQFTTLLNFSTNQFELVGFNVNSLSDTVRVFPASGDLSRFVRPIDQVMKARIAWIPAAELSTIDGWAHYVDQAIWKVDP